MKLLILWSSLADYTVASFKKLATDFNVEIILIYRPAKTVAPFNAFDLSFCKQHHDASKLTPNDIKNIANLQAPDIIFMASWNFPAYMLVAKMCRKNGTRIISAFDNQWRGTLKQYMGIAISHWFLKPVIHNFMVPGDRQAQFAKRLGYNNPYYGFYCANTARFSNQFNAANKQFVFVGRLVHDKGIDIMLEAYANYRKAIENPWPLLVAGKGEFEANCAKQEGVVLKGFIQPNQLTELFAQAGCFLLPSRYEPWGLVVHEAAASGLPMIVSDKCGSSTWFVRDGQNGYVIPPAAKQLAEAMLKIHKKSDAELIVMSHCSSQLANLWTTEKWAKYFYNEILAQ